MNGRVEASTARVAANNDERGGRGIAAKCAPVAVPAALSAIEFERH